MNLKNDNLIDILRLFNRKERFFLVGEVLDNKKFTLGEDFKKILKVKIGIPIKGIIFSAMDYHLDWIDVSLRFWSGDISIGKKFINKEGQINKNQEDIDFIIAFKYENKYHIVLLEAKAETGWTNKQMDSKVKRFRTLFGEDGNKVMNVKPHFYLESPRDPKRINKNWPVWMTSNEKPNWIELKIPDNLLKVTRCDEKKTPSKLGKFCVVNKVKT